jgi:PAS domain S-box-containing protein
MDPELPVYTTDAVVILDGQLHIKYLSPAAEQLCRYPVRSVSGKSFPQVFSLINGETHFLTSYLDATKPTMIHLHLLMADGEREKLDILLVPLPKLHELFMFMRKSQPRSKISKIIEDKSKLEAIFHSRSEGTFTIDKNWTVTSFNRAAENITGFDHSEALGKKCWEIFRSQMCRKGCHMEYTINEKKTSGENELLITSRDGRRIPIRVHSAPLFNANKEYIGGIEAFRDISEIRDLQKHLQERFKFENLVGRSKKMQKVYVLLENVAQTDSTVLITGESGTGKELVARAIHLNSERRNHSFLVVNCSAFAETLLESELFGHERGAFTGAVRQKPGHFELAQGGTLFLDEIGDISLPVQVKLLRVLESRQFKRVGGTNQITMDVRIIAATNRDFNQAIQAGEFREDLYYRINVFNIHLPPLRERLDDLPVLIEHFLEKLRYKFKKDIRGISSPVLNIFFRHQWQGNIRELENVLEHAFVMCHAKTIQIDHLPEQFLFPISRDDSPIITNSMKSAERIIIQNMLERYNGHRNKTARALGINPSTLWRKMKKFGLF